MKLLIIIILSGFSCNFSSKPNRINSPITENANDTIKDPVLKIDCSLALENKTIKVQSSNFPNSTGNAIVKVLIDTTHSLKKIEVQFISIIQNKKIVFESSGNFENEKDNQLKPIIVMIKNTIHKSKIICVNNMKSPTTLFIPLKLILE